MLKPVCIRCHTFFKIKKSGLTIIEGMPWGSGAAPRGLNAPDRWRPYKLWKVDLWSCQSCGFEIYYGSGMKAFRLQHEDDFKEQIELNNATFQVNDC